MARNRQSSSMYTNNGEGATRGGSSQSYASSGSGTMDHEAVLESCHEAFTKCQEVLVHCFGNVGDVEGDHIRLFVDGSVVIGSCAELAARESPLGSGIYRACAEACKACEEACEEYEGESVFEDAAEAFRSCYEACIEAAGGGGLPGWDEEGEQVGESRRGGNEGNTYGNRSGTGTRGNRSARGSTKKSQRNRGITA